MGKKGETALRKKIRHFFDWMLDKVCWVVVYPADAGQAQRSIRLSWTIAKDYAEIFKGSRVVHMDDVEKA